MTNNAIRENAPKIQRKKAKIIQFPKRKNKREKIFKFFSFNKVSVFFIILLTVINLNLRVQISDTFNEINKADKELSEVSACNAILNKKIKSMFSYKNLQREAEKIGMQKRSASQVHYISTFSEDYAEIIRKDD